MKRYITVMVCAVIALVYTDVVTAQPSSANANVTVSVLSTLLVENITGNLVFESQTPDAGETSILPENGVNFRIRGVSGVPVTVTYTPPGPLAGPFDDSVTFTPDVIGGESSEVATANDTGSGLGGPVTTSASGEYYLWLGGTIDVGNIRPGNYSGTFTVTVDYTL